MPSQYEIENDFSVTSPIAITRKKKLQIPIAISRRMMIAYFPMTAFQCAANNCMKRIGRVLCLDKLTTLMAQIFNTVQLLVTRIKEIEEIFSSKTSSSLDAHLRFSRLRYKSLMRCLRFDAKDKREKKTNGIWKDKLTYIREALDIFVRNCKEAYTPGKNLTVDEILLSYRGKCSFRMFIPSKAAKFGIKLFCLVDPLTMYLSNAEIYLGKQDIPEKNMGEAVVMRLARNFLGCDRTIITDNFFTSPGLRLSMLNNKKILLGTVRKNRTGNPKDFFREPLQNGKTHFVFRGKETLLKFQVRKTKQVLLYSTVHHTKAIEKSGKPKIIVDYNQTKFGVDIFDKMINEYAYKPSTRRWPLRIFMGLLIDGGLKTHLFCEAASKQGVISCTIFLNSL